MHSTEKKALALNLLLSLLMAAGYMLLFAYNNTPLGAAIGSDNAMYLTMGTALAKGWAPYVDVFDHKGPLLFALQGLPQWIGGGYNLTAVFLQEVVALFACLTVVRALARALSCPPVWAQLVYLAMTCCVHGRLQPDGGIHQSADAAGAVYGAPRLWAGKNRRKAVSSGGRYGRMRGGGLFAARQQRSAHLCAGGRAGGRAGDHTTVCPTGSVRGGFHAGSAGRIPAHPDPGWPPRARFPPHGTARSSTT